MQKQESSALSEVIEEEVKDCCECFTYEMGALTEVACKHPPDQVTKLAHALRHP